MILISASCSLWYLDSSECCYLLHHYHSARALLYLSAGLFPNIFFMWKSEDVPNPLHPALLISFFPFSISCARNTFHRVLSAFLKPPNHTLFASSNCCVENVEAAVHLSVTRLQRFPVAQWPTSTGRSLPSAESPFTPSFLVSLPHLLRDRGPSFCYSVSQPPQSSHLKRLLPFHLRIGLS